jgi:hypothetical protein
MLRRRLPIAPDEVSVKRVQQAHTKAMSLTSTLYRLARTSATVRALRSPRTASRRAKNVIVGRMLAKAGFWRRLWR